MTDGLTITVAWTPAGAIASAASFTSDPLMSPREAAHQVARRYFGERRFKLTHLVPGTWKATAPSKRLGSGAIASTLLYGLAGMFLAFLAIAAIGYASVWWDYRHLLKSRLPHAPAVISAITDDAGASNHSPRAGALPARDAFQEGRASCTNP